jgi:hypothetical protein
MWQSFSTNLFIKIIPIYFAWCHSVVTATSDSSIIWMCSDWQLFALGPNGRTGRRFSALHIQQTCHRYNKIRLWHTELHCTYILQRISGRSARITTLLIDILFAGAMSINQWLTIKIVTFLKLMDHNTWQELLNRKRGKLKKTEDQFLYDAKCYEPFHEGIMLKWRDSSIHS